MSAATIRTFRAQDARSALAAVKAAFGPQAIILSTREVNVGLFRNPAIEVTAAMPELTEASARPPSPAAAPATAYRAPAPVSPPAPSFEAPAPAERLPRAASGTGRGGGRRWGARTRELFAYLCSRGVEESLAEEALHRALEAAGSRPSALLPALRSLLADRLVPGRAPWKEAPPRIIALVGPTGVGKTTTLAKIAARAIMESRLKISFITVDTYRIGATEQMARYGEIMEVPTHVAKDRAELAQAIEHSAGSDLILIDTAGRSVPEAVARQAELIRSVPSAQLYLVVSAATGARELTAVAERYRGLAPERLIVTKLDEAAGPGSLLTAAVRVDRPIVAIADGQRVPEDLHEVSASGLVDWVIGSPSGTRAERAVAGRQ